MAESSSEEHEVGSEASVPPLRPRTVSDTAAVIVANNPLPENDFPANIPPINNTHLNLTTKPKLLSSVEELSKVMEESRAISGFSNFADLATPKNTATTPIFPTFTRFSSTRFANAEMGEHKVIETGWPETGAFYDMAYPINLTVTDGRNIALPDLPVEGVPDCTGYPLMYNSELPRKLIRPRSSGALYPVHMSRILAGRLDSYPEPQTIRAWAHMFQLSSEKDAQSILLQRAMSSGAGDNHIALLLKAYLAYFDSTAGALDGVQPKRATFSSAGTVININVHDAWASQVLASGVEVVNVLGGAPGFQEFWAYCCFDQPPIYASKTSPSGVLTTTLFSHYKMAPGMAMVCLCDIDAYTTQRRPSFYGQPNVILGYIESYVQKFGLQQQANEALQIAMLWPSLVSVQANISLPKPFHTSDWLGAEIERSTIQTGFQGLIAASPFVTLASTLAGAWAMRSQIYDYVTLLASKRSSWKLSSAVISSTTTWLATNASAPGVGWDFLLRHQFSISPSFLYLTGLSVEVVDWTKLLAGFSWKENQFPAHLRLIQPFWVPTSVCCMLPWEDSWTPHLEMSSNLLTASPTTIMRMLRLGLFNGTVEGIQRVSRSEGIFPILDRDFEETIELGDMSVAQLQTVKDHGIKVLALCARQHAHTAETTFGFRDPSDGLKIRKLWTLLTGGGKTVAEA